MLIINTTQKYIYLPKMDNHVTQISFAWNVLNLVVQLKS